MTDGKAQRPEGSAEAFLGRSEHIPTPEGRGGEEIIREAARVAVRDGWGQGCSRVCAVEAPDRFVSHRCSCREISTLIVDAVHPLLSSPRVEEVRREALEEAARIFWRAGGRARVIEEIAKKMDLYDPRVGDMIRALKEDHP